MSKYFKRVECDIDMNKSCFVVFIFATLFLIGGCVQQDVADGPEEAPKEPIKKEVPSNQSQQTSNTYIYGVVTEINGTCTQFPCNGTIESVVREVYVYPYFRWQDYRSEERDHNGQGHLNTLGLFGADIGEPFFAAPYTITIYAMNVRQGVLSFGDGGQASCDTYYPSQYGMAEYYGCELSHTYALPGTYVTQLRNGSGIVSKSISFTVLDGGIKPVAHATSDIKGNYKIAVPQGRYIVYPKLPSNFSLMSCTNQECVVEAGNRPVQNDITIDMRVYPQDW